MAQSTGDSETIGANISHDSELGEAWQDHAKDFEHKSEALRDALRVALVEDGDTENGNGGMAWHQVAVVGLLAAAIGSLVAQAMIVFDVVVASGLTALALLVVGGVMYAYGE